MSNNDFKFVSQMEMRSLCLRKFHHYYRWYIQISRQSRKVGRAKITSKWFPKIYLYHIGTDSRIGFGYRLGEHADFQVMFELGPQTNTRPIGLITLNRYNFHHTVLKPYFTGNAASTDDDADNSKRNVNPEDYSAPIKANIFMLILKNYNCSQNCYMLYSLQTLVAAAIWIIGLKTCVEKQRMPVQQDTITTVQPMALKWFTCKLHRLLRNPRCGNCSNCTEIARNNQLASISVHYRLHPWKPLLLPPTNQSLQIKSFRQELLQQRNNSQKLQPIWWTWISIDIVKATVDAHNMG